MQRKIEIVFLGIVPFSTNKTKTTNRNGRYYKSTKKDKFQKEIKYQLEPLKDKCKEFKSLYDRKKDYLAITMLWELPRNKFFTKKNMLNGNMIDWDNTVKVPQDSVTNFIGVNDAFICDADVKKRPGDSYKCTIILEIKEIDFF